MGNISPELLVLIEAFLVPTAEFDRLKAQGKLPKADNLSPKGAKALLSILRNWTAQYSTSRKEDMDMLFQLADVTIPTEIASQKLKRMKMAIEVRIGEKLILEEIEKALKETIERAGDDPLKRNERSPQASANKKRRIA